MVGRRRIGTGAHGAASGAGRRAPVRSLALAALVAAVTACTGDVAPAPIPTPDAAAPEVPVRPLVVVTTSILGDVVGELAGDDLELIVLMGPDVDPHDYALSAADAARMRDAVLIVANGLTLEPGIDAALDAVAAEGTSVLRVAESVDPLPFAKTDGAADDHDHAHGHAHDDDHSYDDDHEHGELDPHFWWDPSRMALAVEAITAELVAVPDVDAAAIAVRRDDLLARLADAESEMERLFASIPADRRRIVTNHDALGYLAERFGLDVVGTVIPGSSTSVAADAASFAALIATVDELGVEVVFADNTDSIALAEQLASELVGRRDLELRVVRLYTDALGPAGSGAETYLGMLVTTASTIAEALG